MKAVQSVFVPQTLWGNSSLSIGWLTIDSTPPVLITIPVTGMFLFRNPLFCRGQISTPLRPTIPPVIAPPPVKHLQVHRPENPVNKSSGVDEMISLSEATWHSVSVDEEYYA